MMNTSKRMVWTAVLLGWSSLLLAGPTEDYNEGSKAFYEGKIVDAIPPLKRAADNGHAAAQALLADILDSAEFDEDAAAYYRKAAEQGNPEAQFGLGSMYASGDGVAQNFVEARKWLTQAAKQGNKNAITRLAHSYINGGLGLDETARSGPEALDWIKQAAAMDDVLALKTLAAAYRNGQYGLTADPKQAESLEAKAADLQKKPAVKTEPAKKKAEPAQK